MKGIVLGPHNLPLLFRSALVWWLLVPTRYASIIDINKSALLAFEHILWDTRNR
jgi:hypothetical protein